MRTITVMVEESAVTIMHEQRLVLAARHVADAEARVARRNRSVKGDAGERARVAAGITCESTWNKSINYELMERVSLCLPE